MAPEKSQKVQFILSSDPSLESQKQARMHAARVAAHVRKSRFRVIEYRRPGENENNGRKKTMTRRNKPRSDEDGRETRKKVEKQTGEKAENNLFPLPSHIEQLVSSNQIYPSTTSARSFNQVERFLFCYYSQVLIPAQSIHCHLMWSGARYCDLVNQKWTPLAVSRLDSLDSVFLLACRHLSLCQQQLPERKEYYMQLATRYKMSCIRVLNKSISAEISSLINDVTLATVVMLGFDEMLLGDMATSRHHALGALKMVKHNGGGQTLGLDGFLEYIVYKLWGDVQHAKPAEIVVDA